MSHYDYVTSKALDVIRDAHGYLTVREGWTTDSDELDSIQRR